MKTLSFFSGLTYFTIILFVTVFMQMIAQAIVMHTVFDFSQYGLCSWIFQGFYWAASFSVSGYLGAVAFEDSNI